MHQAVFSVHPWSGAFYEKKNAGYHWTLCNKRPRHCISIQAAHGSPEKYIPVCQHYVLHYTLSLRGY